MDSGFHLLFHVHYKKCLVILHVSNKIDLRKTGSTVCAQNSLLLPFRATVCHVQEETGGESVMWHDAFNGNDGLQDGCERLKLENWHLKTVTRI
jgi:hypothetical protein